MSTQNDTESNRMTIDHRALVQSMAVPYLAYEAAPPYRILDENEAHEKVAMTKRDDIIGRPFLEVYPDTSDEFKKTGKSAPIESIKKIVQTKQPDSLGDFKWEVRDKNGALVTKYWRATQYPIFDEGGTSVVAVYQLTEDITHEMQTEQTLEKTQMKLMEVLAAGRVGTWSFDLKSGIAKGGPNLSRMFGINPDKAAKGIPLKDFVTKIHEDDRGRVQAEIEAAIQTGERYESEYRIKKNDGSVRWVLARGETKEQDLEGNNIFSGTLIDITDHKEKEQVLIENESRLKFLADSMPQLVWISAPNGKGQYFNHRWYEFTGAKNDGGPLPWAEFVHPDDIELVKKTWARSIKTSSSYELEYRLFNAESKMYRWVIARAMPFKSDEGMVINWYGTCTDIDEQRRAADIQTFLAKASKELSSSLNYQKTLKKVTELCVPLVADWCTVDLLADDGTFEQVGIAHRKPEKIHEAVKYRKLNPVDMSQPTGLPAVVRSGKPEFYPYISDELLEQHIDDEEKLNYMKSLDLHSIIIAPIKINGEVKGGLTFVSSESGRYYTDTDVAMANDLAARISFALTNSFLYSESTRNLKLRKKLEDDLRHEKQKLELRVKERTEQLQLTNEGLRDEIHKRQSVEIALNKNSEELTRSNQELEDFAYVASHDLQEPLRKIQAFGNLLLAEYGDSLGIEGADYLQRMHSAANRMSTLIADLLAFSRVTRMQQRLVPVDLSKVIKEVSSDLESRINDTNAEIKIGKLPTVNADPTHMRQLFQNLIGNAVKFHQPNVPPVVTVRSRAKRGGYEITVADNGIGFDEKYLDRIFAVFQRLHERSSYEGTGIGLAVCRKIVERYGGTITAESTKNVGSTFIIWLPAKKDRALHGKA